MRVWHRLILVLGGLLAVSSAEAQTIVTIGGGFVSPAGLAIDGSGNLIVADQGTALVQRFSAASDFTAAEALNRGLGTPGAVAIDSQGNLFVTDSARHAVDEIEAAGGYQTVRALGGGGFTTPAGIAIDRSGNLFVADLGQSNRQNTGGVFELLAADGYASVRTLVSGVSNPRSIAVDANDNIFVSDLYSGAVSEVEAAGGYVKTDKLMTALEAGDLAVDAHDNLFVADLYCNVIDELLAPTGYAVKTILAPKFSRLIGLTIDASGNLFAVDQQSGNNVIDEIAVAGGYATATPVASHLYNPGRLAIDGSANLFVTGAIGSGTLDELPAAGGYAQGSTLITGFVAPDGVAVDAAGDIFVVDGYERAVRELPASGGGVAVTSLGASLHDPTAIAMDRATNLFVTDYSDSAVDELPASGGYSSANVIYPDLRYPTAVAIDSAGNLFVAGDSPVILELLAASGYTQTETISGVFTAPAGLAFDGADNLYVADPGTNAVYQLPAASRYATARLLGSGFLKPVAIAVDRAGNVFVADQGKAVVKEILATSPTLVASVLPGSRSVQVGDTATIFAAMINTGVASLDSCQVGLPAAVSGLILTYQTTNPATNEPVGTPDTPVTIPGGNGLQTFILSLGGTAPLDASGLALQFSCAGGQVAPAIRGVDTIDLLIAAAPVAEIITEAATPANNGILAVANGATGAFAVASTNIGAADTIAVTADTGDAYLPVQLTLCQTDPSSGQCLATPAAAISLSFAGQATPTFSVFARSFGPIAFAPASSRIFVRFKDAAGGLHGSTSVAVMTD